MNTLADAMFVMGAAARDAARALRESSSDTRNEALRVAASALRARAPEILSANAADLKAATDSSAARANSAGPEFLVSP